MAQRGLEDKELERRQRLWELYLRNMSEVKDVYKRQSVMASSDTKTAEALVGEALTLGEGLSRPLRYVQLNSFYNGSTGSIIDVYKRQAFDRERLGYRFVKRAFDIAFSACVIAAAIVPSAVLCAAIAVESPGCPLYRQRRVGRIGADGRPREFTMWKFRSMVKGADQMKDALLAENEVEGPMSKMRDDPRVTRIGRFIRRHSIDEFPQFLNVLLGDMSVVGPRPPLRCV